MRIIVSHFGGAALDDDDDDDDQIAYFTVR